MKKTLTIQTEGELLEFIKRDKVTPEQACEVLRTALKVYAYPEDKDIMIKKIENYLKRWEGCKEKPVFLETLTDEFKIDSLYKTKD